MTTLAISPIALRRLFDYLDYAPQPKSGDLSELLGHWRERRGGKVLPSLAEIDPAEAGVPQQFWFIFRPSDPPGDFVLSAGAEALAPLLGPCAAGDALRAAPRSRAAARLRRLFAAASAAGEPILAAFASREGEPALVEVLAAPLAGEDPRRPAILGGLALRPLLHGPRGGARYPLKPGAAGPLLFALGDSRGLGEAIADHVGLELAAHEERDFEDGEHKTRPLVGVRGRDVYVLAGLAGGAGQSANDRLCRLLFFIATLKDAGAVRVTALAPYLSYARKDRQTKTRDPVTIRYVAELFETVGADALLTLEAHNLAAFQNAFRCLTVHLDADLLFAEHFAAILGEAPAAVASPDLGGAKRAERFRQRLEARLGRPVAKAFMDKQRSMGKVTGDIFAGDVAGRIVIVVDDMIASGTTMARMAAACRAHGAEEVHLAATHGLFSEGAPALMEARQASSIVVTDSVSPLRIDPGRLGGRLKVLSVAPLLAEALARCHAGGSIAELLGR